MRNAVNNASSCLSEAALAAIASNQADQAELRQYESHLETCRHCCELLDALSADPSVWQSARSFLCDDEFDRLRFECSGGAEMELPEGAAELLKFLAPTDDPHMLGRLGSYEVSGIIGAGGMGIVLKALEPALGRFVALKVLAPRFWKDAQARERFAREARAAASIVHENVIEIYGVAQIDGIPFFSMPYLRGDTLQARIDRQGPLAVDEILRVAMQVASGLAAAHAQGLVHRDIKPANILLGAGAERVRITDFGIAHLGADPRLTQSGVVAGTPQYMSPEQVRGETVDGRSDLFSLGSVIYAMAAGRPPFEADSHYRLLHKVATADSPRLDEANPAIPSWLAAVVAKLHAPSPADRYQSAKELAGDLEQCLAAVQQPKRISQPRSVTQLASKYRRRRRMNVSRIVLGGVLMFAAVIAVVLAALASGLMAPSASVAADSIKVEGQVVDDQGGPVAGVTVLAVQKTWPNNQYQQQMLKTTTNKEGRFAFEDFAEPGKQYAFLLSVISDRWLMTSEYRLVRDGKQQDPIRLTTEKSEPVKMTFVLQGKPVSEIRALPTRRVLADGGLEYLSYPQQVWDSGVSSDEAGVASFGSWKPGEKGTIAYLVVDEIETFEFQVPDNRVVLVPLKAAPKKPAAGPSVDVSGQVVDSAGKPVADVEVLAIRKTWPNNRYRQEALAIKTDGEGKFRFDRFAPSGRQYAFLLTLVADGYAMTSEYRVVEDGSQQEPITLRLEKTEPVTLVLKDSQGNLLEGVEVSPDERIVDASTTYLNYSMQMRASKLSDKKGEVSFSAWKPGESGSIHYRRQQEYGEIKFTVGMDGRAEITIPEK
jgi:serine/threonine protein kinase